MNFLADVIGAGFKGALIKFFRLLFFAIIILIVVYVVGIFTNKKAHALVIKQSIPITYKNGFDRQTELINTLPNTSTAVEFELTTPLDTNYSLIGFNMVRFGIHGTWGGTQNTYACTFNYLNGQLNSFTCPEQNYYERAIASYAGEGEYYHVYGFVRYVDGTTGTCYRSTEYENYIMCPTSNSPIKSFVFRLNTALANNYFTGIYYSVTMNDEVLAFNYESTEIINSNGVIIQQQQQTNQALTDSNTTTSQSAATGAVSSIQQNMNTKLKGTNELTQMVMAPLTSLISISSTTCQPITWNIPLVNYTATIPCMSTIYNQYFSAVITLFATIITGVYSYRTIVKLVSTIKDALDAESDKLEVLDL